MYICINGKARENVSCVYSTAEELNIFYYDKPVEIIPFSELSNFENRLSIEEEESLFVFIKNYIKKKFKK